MFKIILVIRLGSKWPQELISLLYAIIISLTSFSKIWIQLKIIKTRSIWISIIISILLLQDSLNGIHMLLDQNIIDNYQLCLQGIQWKNHQKVRILDKRLLCYYSEKASYQGSHKITDAPGVFQTHCESVSQVAIKAILGQNPAPKQLGTWQKISNHWIKILEIFYLVIVLRKANMLADGLAKQAH